MQDRDFKGVWIPKEVWLNDELTLIEKIIFVEIDSLDNENNCVASNEYFSEFCGCSISKVSKAIKKLEELNMIEVLSFNGRNRKIRVIGSLVKNDRQPSKKYEAASQKMTANNIYNNITNKTNIINNISKKPKKSLFDKCLDLINDFSEDENLRDNLVQCLKMFLENSKENNIPFYTNTFKGKLNKLNNLSNDVSIKNKIVLQTLDNGWNNFYELKQDNKYSKTRDVRKDIEGLNTRSIPRVDIEEMNRRIENGELEQF